MLNIKKPKHPEWYLIATTYFCLVQSIRHSGVILNFCSFAAYFERHHFVNHERGVLVTLVHFVVFPHRVYKESVQHILFFHLYGVDGVHQVGVVQHNLRRAF